MKPRYLRLIAGLLCFATGLAVDRALPHRSAKEKPGSGAAAASPPAGSSLPQEAVVSEVRSADRHRRPAASGDLVSRLLEDDWSDATYAELAQGLTDDPALINAIWRETPEEQRDRMLFRVLAFGCHSCPSLIYRILPQIDFDLPSPKIGKAAEVFKGSIYCDPERGMAALRTAAAHFQKADLNDILSWISNTSRPGSRALLKAALLPGADGFGDERLFQGAASNLLRWGETLPPGAENLPGVRSAMETIQKEAANLKAARDWQAAGFSRDALATAAKTGRPAEGLERLVWQDVIPPPGAFAALAAGDKPGVAKIVMKALIRVSPDQAYGIIKTLPDFDEHDAFVFGLVTSSDDPGFPAPELLDLAGIIKDQNQRDAATKVLLERLAKVDPERADALLGRIADPELRQQAAEKIDEQEVGP